MDANTTNASWLKAGITLGATLIALAHLVWPNLGIDAITVTLLVVAVAPWLSPIFKSLQFPGGLKIEYPEIKAIKEQMNSIIASTAEPAAKVPEQESRLRAFSVNDDATRSVIKALGNPKFTWRYLGGLTTETHLPRDDVLKSINWLLQNKLVSESQTGDEKLWALSQEGRNLLVAIAHERGENVGN